MSHSNRSTALAAMLCATAVQFFIAQAIVQLGWTTPFSLRENFISDLGNTTCGPYPLDSAMYVCSPWHAWMNASFVLFGAQIIAGTILFFRSAPFSLARTLGWALIFLAGPGVILVGLYPENESIELHRLGVLLQDLRRRTRQYPTFISIDHDLDAFQRRKRQIDNAHHGRHTHCTSQDRHVRITRA